MSSAAESIRVRLAPGESADLDAVMDVMASAFDRRFGEGWTRSQCAGILPLSGVVLMLAEEHDEVCGFSLLRAVVDEAELLLLAVAPDAQRRGIGGALLDHFIEHGRRNGIRRLHLEVRDGNPAVAMYSDSRRRAAGLNIIPGVTGASMTRLQWRASFDLGLLQQYYYTIAVYSLPA